MYSHTFVPKSVRIGGWRPQRVGALPTTGNPWSAAGLAGTQFVLTEEIYACATKV